MSPGGVVGQFGEVKVKPLSVPASKGSDWGGTAGRYALTDDRVTLARASNYFLKDKLQCFSEKE